MTTMIDILSSKPLLFLSTSLSTPPKINKKRLGTSRKNKINIELLKSKGYHTGKWTQEEHIQFLQACLKYGNNWTKVIYPNPGKGRVEDQISSTDQKPCTKVYPKAL